jgi:exodeoxyribonuclease V beta subunit
MQHALLRRGVASVYLSDRESVFHSPQAADLVHWLAAVAQPQDVRLARAALATRLLARTGDELDALARDDDTLDAHLAVLAQLHQVWRQRGVLAVLRQTLHRLDLPARWMAQPDGERALTNLLHLGELLQAATDPAEGEAALLRWLVARIQTPRVETDDQVVRLESDADRVQIVTVHKSKGLEYPVVFLPFATALRPVDRRRLTHVRETAPDGSERLRLNVRESDLAVADEERLREDVRLLYVALTRARHALWLGFGRIRSGRQTDPGECCDTHRSALGSLLAGDQPLDGDGWRAVWTQLCTTPPPDALSASPAAPDSPPQPLWCLIAPAPDDTDPLTQPAAPLLPDVQAPRPLRPAQPYLGRFERDWGVGSFSSLVRDLSDPGLSLLAASVRNPAQDEALAPHVGAAAGRLGSEAHAAAAVGAVGANSRFEHRFERGPLAGNFLHDLLEALGQEGFDLSDDTPQGRENAIRLRQQCARAGHGEQAHELLNWMRRVLIQPLGPVGGSLSGVKAPLAEMAFWLPVQALGAAALGQQCHQQVLTPLWQQANRRAPAPALAVPELSARMLNGLLMGFADLVFEHAGRYWVLDYKSNHLGPQPADYSASALAADMARHRYDVQAALYTLALHRLLASRLGAAYRPQQHLGGAIYLYLRGLEGPAGGVCHVPPPFEWLATWSPDHEAVH